MSTIAMNDVMTIAPRTTRVERSISPVAELRTTGDLCSPYAVVTGHATVPSMKDIAGVVTDERGFAGMRAWSPPGC